MSATVAESTLPDRTKRLVLIACILGTTVVTVDSTAVNVALPSIASELGGGLAGQQWTANAYLVTLGSLLLVGGSLGDIFGERRAFAAGVAGFGLTSLLCAVAPSIWLLVGARALQGVFGALLTPAALAVIVATFAESERGRAVGTWTAWGGIGTVFGPVVGGQLVDAASWRWIFALNIPLVIGTVILIRRVLPPDHERDPSARVDVVGAALCALGLAGATYGLIEQPLRGFGSPAVFLPLAAGLALLAGFVVWERRTLAPMLPLRLFGRRNFAIGNAQTFTMYAGLGVVFFLLGLFLQQVAGFSALKAGGSTLPVTIVMFFLAARFGRLADTYGPRLFMGGGPLVAAAGLVLMQRVGAHVDYVTELLPALVVFALGLALTVAPLTATVLADADAHNAGVASAVNNAIARVAGLVAIAAIGAVVAAHAASRLDTAARAAPPGAAAAFAAARDRPLSVPRDAGPVVMAAARDASVSAFHFGLGICAVLVAGGGVLGLVGIRNPRRELHAENCRGGQLYGAPREASGQSPCDWGRQALPEPEAA